MDSFQPQQALGSVFRFSWLTPNQAGARGQQTRSTDLHYPSLYS